MGGRTHGMSSTNEFRIWKSMRARCANMDDPSYGGRGIRVCERWQDFANFLADMGNRPSSKHSVERVNNDGPYSPENCRWATMAEQRRNTRASRWIELDGQRKLLVDWAQEAGVSAAVILARMKKWPLREALTRGPCPRIPNTHDRMRIEQARRVTRLREALLSLVGDYARVRKTEPKTTTVEELLAWCDEQTCSVPRQKESAADLPPQESAQ